MDRTAANHRQSPKPATIFVFFHGRHENQRELGGHTTYGCVITGGETGLYERAGYLGKSVVSSWSRGIPEFKGIRSVIGILQSYGLPWGTVIHILLDDESVMQQLCLKAPASEIAAPHLGYLLDALKPFKRKLNVIPCPSGRPEMARARELSLKAMLRYAPYAANAKGD